MRTTWFVAITMTAVASTACYHATIDMGVEPSNQVIEKSWAAGWIYGLVPPNTVEPASKCPHGVAKVETQLSFLNQLVSFLTLYIYTPMSIKVTCAAAKSADAAPATADLIVSQAQGERAVESAFAAAATRAVATQRPVFVEVR
jgi:hypothetical protein